MPPPPFPLPTGETEQDPVGLLGAQAFPCPPFLVFGEWASASTTFPEFRKAGSDGCSSGRGGAIQRQWGSLGAGSWFLLKECTVSSPAELRHLQKEDVAETVFIPNEVSSEPVLGPLTPALENNASSYPPQSLAMSPLFTPRL